MLNCPAYIKAYFFLSNYFTLKTQEEVNNEGIDCLINDIIFTWTAMH